MAKRFLSTPEVWAILPSTFFPDHEARRQNEEEWEAPTRERKKKIKAKAQKKKKK